MSFQVETVSNGEILVVKMKGELDHHTARIVKDELDKQSRDGTVKHMIFNLRELVFMDSSGIGMLLGRYKVLTQRGGRMGICEMSPAIARLLEMSGLFKILVVGDNERQVISRLEVVS
jgi:stage II sporulation protein AA (anti-sigma F factor antagonist)